MTEQAKNVSDELVEVFDKIVSQYPDAERRQHSGYPAAFLNGNMVCGLHEDSMMIRLSERDRETFLKIKGASMFEAEEAEDEPEPEPEESSGDEAALESAPDNAERQKGGRNNGRGREREDMSEYVVSPASVTKDEAELDRWLGKSFTYVSTLPDRPRRGGRSRPDRGNSIHADSGRNNNNNRNQNNRGRKKSSKKSGGGGRKKTSRKKSGQRRSRNRQSGSNQQQ